MIELLNHPETVISFTKFRKEIDMCITFSGDYHVTVEDAQRLSTKEIKVHAYHEGKDTQTAKRVIVYFQDFDQLSEYFRTIKIDNIDTMRKLCLVKYDSRGYLNGKTVQGLIVKMTGGVPATWIQNDTHRWRCVETIPGVDISDDIYKHVYLTVK